jgi:hypothetical protein
VTTSDPSACPASNFAVEPQRMAYPLSVPTSPAGPVKVAEGQLRFVDQGDQTACSGKTVTVKAQL